MLTTNLIRTACLCVALSLSVLPTTAIALPVEHAPAVMFFSADAVEQNGTTQRNCTTLSQAVEQVRRRGNVERVISAQTRVSGGREVHHIKVLTKDGKVRTHTVNGCKR